MGTEVAEHASSFSSVLNWKAFEKAGAPHIIAMKIEEPVTGDEHSLHATHGKHLCMVS